MKKDIARILTIFVIGMMVICQLMFMCCLPMIIILYFYIEENTLHIYQSTGKHLASDVLEHFD